jgi:hypothetical protein
VNEAICTVVMMRKPIASEEHLMGAFWTAVRLLVRHYHEGRRRIRVGARSRVDFESAALHAATDDPAPDQVVELKDRLARAADFMAQLSELERQVVTIMAARGTGIKLTARILDLPAKTVKAAARSAEGKLDRVATIAAAGRMCGYRHDAIAAHARGIAHAEDERVARAHLAACARCRHSYVQIVREMRRHEFQRGAAAAFLPILPSALGHHLGFAARLLGKAADRLFPPGGAGERTVEVLGGAGAVKVATASGAAVLVATTTIATGVHSLTGSEHHYSRVHRAGHAALRRPTAQHVAVGPPAGEARIAAAPSAPPQPHTPRVASLSPRERAALEFSFSGSPSSQTHSGPVSGHIASARASSASTSSTPEQRGSTARRGESVARSGASPAAREFGQP